MPLKIMASDGDRAILNVPGLDEPIVIEVLMTGHRRCQYAIDAPQSVRIHRQEAGEEQVDALPDARDYPLGARIAVVNDSGTTGRFICAGDSYKRYWDRYTRTSANS